MNNPLITPEEAEKAAKKFICESKKDSKYEYEIYFEATEAANTKFSESVTPVLVKCKEALERQIAFYGNSIFSDIAKERIADLQSTLTSIDEFLKH